MSRPELGLVGHHCLALCEIPSVIGHEAVLADFIAHRYADRWPMRRLGNNLVFGGPTAPGRELVAFFGHLDTVPGDPHPPRVEADRLVVAMADPSKRKNSTGRPRKAHAG